MQAASHDSFSKHIFLLSTKKSKERVGRTNNSVWLSMGDSNDGVSMGLGGCGSEGER